MTSWTLAIAKFETSKFRICVNKTKILESSFESTKSETKSRQSTSKLHQRPSVIPLKFCGISLVSRNFLNYCKILQFLIKFCKSLKDLRKILLKWLGKTVKYCFNFINFHSCTEKWMKVGQLLSTTLRKNYGIPRRFSLTKTFSFDKISSLFVSPMTEIFCFTKISQLPITALLYRAPLNSININYCIENEPSGIWAERYKTFYGRNLLMFTIS